jgi:hypothetical protein
MERSEAWRALSQATGDKLGESTATPDVSFSFRLCECECGETVLVPRLEHEPSSDPADFVGAFYARCVECGRESKCLEVCCDSSAVRVREEPSCPHCDGHAFHLGLCDRYEDGGIFDCGVVMGLCPQCQEVRTILQTD